MAFLSAKDEAAVKQEFERIGGPVKLTVFASELGGEHNGQTVALIREVAGAQDYGIRFLGMPAGYEFSNLIDSIIAVSTGDAGLSDATKAALAGLTEDVTIKVFATPT
jgi:alkyl hydroperoxide reductase subunit AhpF